MTLSQQLDKIYLWAPQQKGLEQGADFLKGLLIKYDIIKNKKVRHDNSKKTTARI